MIPNRLIFGPFMLATLSLALAGCQVPRPATARSEALRAGEDAYHRGDFPGAAERLTSFLAQAPPDELAARARYVRGLALARDGRRAAAYPDFDAAARQARDPRISGGALAMLGIMQFEDERWTNAERCFLRALQRMPAGPPRDALMYRAGLCRERSGNWAGAPEMYRGIVANFPNGPYTDFARRRLALAPDHFSVQCGVFSQSKNASELVDDLRGRSLDAFSRSEVRDGRSVYVVLVGRYATYEEALGALGRVRGYVAEAVLWP